MSRFEEYMRDSYLGLGDMSASPQSTVSRPPLYPQQGSERRSAARTPPTTPPTQPLQPVPAGRSQAGYQQPQQSYAPIFQQQQPAPVTHQQQQQPVAVNHQQQQQQPFSAPPPSNQPDTAHLLILNQEKSIMSLENTVAELTEDNKELKSLTAEASNMLHSVQSELDASLSEATKMMQKLLPEEHQTKSQIAADVIRQTAQYCEKILQSTLDDGAKLEIENQTLRENEKQLQKELLKQKEQNVNATTSIGAEQRAARLERELESNMTRQNDLLQKITDLQTELMESRAEGTPISNSQAAKMKAVYDVSNAELQDKVQQLQADLRRSEVLRTDLEKQLVSQERLLKTTEAAFKKERSQLQSQDLNSDLHVDLKEGYLLKLVDETWHKRWVVSNLQCLQNFSSDIEAQTGHSRKGCRWYAMQAAFVSRFSSNLAEATDPVTGLSCYHPLAADPNCYYFGFLPKPENDSTPYLLKTDSREIWLSWSRFLSKQVCSSFSFIP
eukprot:TRINITY_DN6240_c0_g1_i2.p1 TRINITY_DN6240_c0_g1~~TRINITY_DN6240_c0_g1_i2.p1  ORF type:complete len:498 (+),score=130.05 TRINITY_DN6240_c0_g1_i2:821-2314(+)